MGRPSGLRTWRVHPAVRLNSGVCSGWWPYLSYGAIARLHIRHGDGPGAISTLQYFGWYGHYANSFQFVMSVGVTKNQRQTMNPERYSRIRIRKLCGLGRHVSKPRAVLANTVWGPFCQASKLGLEGPSPTIDYLNRIGSEGTIQCHRCGTERDFA